jgi:PAS domain S-box-containing protein
MEQTTARILERSSDAIVIIRLSDGAILGINEAYFAVTGYPQHELASRNVRDLFVDLGATRSTQPADGVDGGPSAEASIGLWTRSGELRCGQLSALVVDLDGQGHAVCTIREIRDPTPADRRRAARARFARIVDTGGPPLEVATRAIQALGESLRWEFGALWLQVPGSETLRCAAVWRSPLADLAALEETSWRTHARSGVGLVGRSWRDRRAAWASDAVMELDPQRLDQVGDLVRSWFGFPVWAGGQVVGIVELLSREVRQPDEELLSMTEQLGGLLGRRIIETEGEPGPSDGAATAAPRPASEAVSSALRDLKETVATMADASQRQHGAPAGASPELLRELAAGIGRLDRLLEGAAEAGADRPAGEPRVTAPTGLTLKAVSRRTGIPGATLRTWERRYQFLRPERSTNGYRRYGEEEIARIMQVKDLLRQGVRIGEAMETVGAGPGARRATG